MTPVKSTILHHLPIWLLMAIVFCLPWQIRWIAVPGIINNAPWEYGTVSLYGLDILILLFLLFACGQIKQSQRRFHFSLSQVLALFIVIIAFFSTSFASERSIALFWLLKLAEGVALFLCIPAIHFSQQRIRLAFIASGVIQSILALIQFFMQSVVGSKWVGMATQSPATLGVQVVEGPWGRVLRSYGSLPHPNMLGGLLAVCMLICIVAYIEASSRRFRGACTAALLVLSSGLWSTFSRQAWIATGVGIAVLIAYIFLREKLFPRRLVASLLYAVLPFLLLSAIFPALVLTRTQAQNRLEERSLHERAQYAQESLDILHDNWITGVGIGNYTVYVHEKDIDNHHEQPAWAYQPVHAVPLLIFSELGLFGILAWLWFLMSLLWHWHWKNERIFIWMLPMFMLLIIALFDHYLWSLHFGIIFFWLCAAFLEREKEHA
ncbi:MAG: O-antigen ligase family protein [Candidatus Kerfeldbacteria bacterium]|nr:O-antigen ligase family protein [Candidatus Kerfeldbacteria bacterium]